MNNKEVIISTALKYGLKLKIVKATDDDIILQLDVSVLISELRLFLNRLSDYVCLQNAIISQKPEGMQIVILL